MVGLQLAAERERQSGTKKRPRKLKMMSTFPQGKRCRKFLLSDSSSL